MGGPGSGRHPGGSKSRHPVQITSIKGVIKKIGASHKTVVAGKREKLHNKEHRIGNKKVGFTTPGGLKISNKHIAFRVNF